MKYSEPLLPGKFYHLYNHTVGNDNLFIERKNYLYFLDQYSYYIHPVCKTYAYCLMPNHFHFLVQVRDNKRQEDALDLKDSLVKEKPLPKKVIQCFSNLFNSYAKSYNKRFDRKGALFIDYVRRKEINNPNYFTRLIAYIHNNPVHHGFCKSMVEWEFSSYHSYISDRKTKVARDEAMIMFENFNKFQKYHQIKDNFFPPNEIEELEFL